jgi:hypothetical protein
VLAALIPIEFRRQFQNVKVFYWLIARNQRSKFLGGPIQGTIDGITSTGYVEGWAASRKNPFDAVSVCIVYNRKPISAGIANRFRTDLLAHRIGHGWHGFRVRIDEALDPQNSARLSLVDPKSMSLITVADLPCPKHFRLSQLDLEALLDDTALEVTDISSLKLVEPAFEEFIHRNGIDEFVECAYCYILGRPADPSGRGHYAKLISMREITPLAFLAKLFNSDERRNSKWPVLAPSDPGFFFAPEKLD